MIEFLLGPLVVTEALAEVYSSPEQAGLSIFPGVKLEPKSLKLQPAEKSRIEKDSGENVRAEDVTYFRGKAGETLYVDRVLGKHQFITYAVGIDPAGAVKGIEILEYKETYGHEVRRPAWRQQFTGKTVGATLALDKDIQNISGATLSSAHVTGGVKRVLHTHAVLKNRL